MTDIVERLRRDFPQPIKGAVGDLHEAAAEITSLRTRIYDLERERDEAREALIWISDQNWLWKGGGSDVRYRGIYGNLAAKTLGISQKLPLGWPDPENSETLAAIRALQDKGERG